MPTRKIADAEYPCLDSDHNPPNNMCYPPGKYEHECPSCHKKTVFTVPVVIS